MVNKSTSKIVIFLPSLEQGGAERRMTLLALDLFRKGYSVEVLVLRRQGVFIELLDDAGIQIKTIGKGGRWDFLGAFVRTYIFFKKQHCHTVFSCLPSANVFSVIAKLANYKVRLIWGIAAADMPIAKYGLWAKMGYAVQRYLSIFANRIVVNSSLGEQVAREQGYSDDKLLVIRNGIDLSTFYYDRQGAHQRREQWRSKHQISTSAYVIGLIGRLDPAKGIELFLQSIHADLEPEWNFVIMGSGKDDYANHLRRMIQEHPLYGQKLFLIEDEQVNIDTYHALDLLTITSVSEGLPNVLLEALASGLRVVSTDVGDCRLVMAEHGRVIVKHEVKEITNAWQSEFATEYDPQVITEYIEENFSLDNMTQQFEQLIEV